MSSHAPSESAPIGPRYSLPVVTIRDPMAKNAYGVRRVQSPFPNILSTALAV